MFRHYLLDLMRVTPRDSNYTGPGSRFCVLRPELVALFCQVFPHSSIIQSILIIILVILLIILYLDGSKAEASESSLSQVKTEVVSVAPDPQNNEADVMVSSENL